MRQTIFFLSMNKNYCKSFMIQFIVIKNISVTFFFNRLLKLKKLILVHRTSCGVGRLIQLITHCVILYTGVGDF